MSNNMDKQSYIDEAEKELLHTYNRFSRCMITARGYHLYDRWQCISRTLPAGIAVCALGL